MIDIVKKRVIDWDNQLRKEKHFNEKFGTNLTPSEVKELVSEYLDECFRTGISSGRIIHGKGIGTLREIVHSVLRTHSKVSSFQLGGMNSGNWGSTSFSLNIETNNN